MFCPWSSPPTAAGGSDEESRLRFGISPISFSVVRFVDVLQLLALFLFLVFGETQVSFLQAFITFLK